MRLFHANNASAWTGPTGNNTYLFTGRTPALIDAGVGNRDHLDAIASALDGRPLATVLLTHGHPDHVGGLDAIRERWPSVAVVRFGSGVEMVDAGEDRLRMIHTPGHAPDHVCFFDDKAGDLYCGDLIRAGGSIVIPASRGGNLQQYLGSLRAMQALSPRRLLPGHGPVIDDPAAAIAGYLQHREQREQDIVTALRDGLTTPEAIASQVYGPLAPALAAAAADSVLAHLVKLRDEQRAFLWEDGWRLS